MEDKPTEFNLYDESEKVSVVLVRNVGILLENGPQKKAITDTGDNPVEHEAPRGRKRESIFQQAHKIPVEITRTARGRTSKRGWKKYAGFSFGIISSICLSLSILLAKVLRASYGHHPIGLTTWRYVGVFVPAPFLSLYFHWCTPEQIFDSIFPLSNFKNVKHCLVYVLQGICACGAVIFQFYSFDSITIGDSTAIVCSSLVFSTIIAYFMQSGKCTIVTILVIILALSGIAVISRPGDAAYAYATFDHKLWVGIVMAVAAMVCRTGLLILIKNIRQTHFSVMMLVSGGWGLIQSTTLGLAFSLIRLPKELHEGFILAMFCILTFVGHLCIILALKYETGGHISVVRASEVVFAFLWQLLVLGVQPDLYSYIGASVILLAVVLLAAMTWMTELTPDNEHRKRLLNLTNINSTVVNMSRN